MKHLSNYQVIQALTDRQKDAIIRYEIEDQSKYLRRFQHLRLSSALVSGYFTALACLAFTLHLPLTAKEIERWSVRELGKL